MPDYYTGYYDEARLRGAQAAPQQSAPAPSMVYNGRYGTFYGEPGQQWTDAQALEYVNRQNAGAYANGSLPVDYWQRYHPNATADELRAYQQANRAYNQNTKGTGGVGNSLHNAGSFELDHIGNIFEGLRDEPSRLVFGFDPIGTKIGNAITGRDYDPLVNQMGGATSQQIADYERVHGTNSAGAAQGLHNAAAGTAAVIAAGTLANGGLTGGQGGGSSSLYTMTPEEQSAITSGLTNVPAGGAGEVAGFGGYGTAGLPADLAGDLAGTQLGAAGNGLVLEGGAGTIGGSWLDGLTKYGQQLGGLVSQGGGGAGGSAPQLPPMPPMGMLGSQAPQQTATRQQSQGLNQTMQRSRGYMRTPIEFRGATIWV